MENVLFEKNEKKPNQSILEEIKNAFMTGITFVIPLIIAGAIVAACNMGLFVPGVGLFSMLLLTDGIGLVGNALVWFLAAVVGAVFSTIVLLILRKLK